MDEMVPKISVPMNFGIHLLNSPTHNTLELKASQGAVVPASSVILSLNSPKIDHMTTTLHLTSVDMTEFTEKSVRSFVEASYTGSVPPIAREMFRDLNKMAHVFEVTWLVSKCVQRFSQIADGILQPTYPDLQFLFEEAAFVASKLKSHQLKEIALKRITSLNWKKQFISQYLESSEGLSNYNLDMVIELAGTDVHFIVQPLTDMIVTRLGVWEATLPPDSKYLLQHCDLFLYRQHNAEMFEQLFDLLQEVSNEIQEDSNWIFKLYRSSRNKKALAAATEPATIAAVPTGEAGPSRETAGDVEVGTVQSAPRYPNPSLLHTLDSNKSFSKLVGWLGVSDEVTTLLMYIQGLVTWMVRNTSTNIKCTPALLERFIKIKQRRQWRTVPTGYVLYGLTDNTKEFLTQLIQCTALCSPREDTTQWAWVRCSVTIDVTVNTLFGQERKLVFHFKHPAVENCTKLGECGFVLKLTPAKDGGDITLCTDPGDYSDDVHFHEEVRTGIMHLDARIYNISRVLPLTWCGRPRAERDAVHWGPLPPTNEVEYIYVIISL